MEEAFYTTDRVMTVSFHKFGDYFPGTGDIQDIGYGKGKYYSVNVPLDDGIDDESYQYLFKPVMSKVMEVFQPGAVVLQCGADSLSGDRLGCFNLSEKGHAECVRYMRSFNVPLLLVGGGGYTIRNVARCWCYETAVALGVEVDEKVPDHEYHGYFGPDYTLHVPTSNMENKNSRRILECIKNKVLDNISRLQHVPSVQFQERPPDVELPEGDEEGEDKDERRDHGSDILMNDFPLPNARSKILDNVQCPGTNMEILNNELKEKIRLSFNPQETLRNAEEQGIGAMAVDTPPCSKAPGSSSIPADESDSTRIKAEDSNVICNENVSTC